MSAYSCFLSGRKTEQADSQPQTTVLGEGTVLTVGGLRCHIGVSLQRECWPLRSPGVTENNIPSHTVASSIFTLLLKQPAQALMDTFISKASDITEVKKHFFTMVCSTNLNEATLGGPSGNQLKVRSILRLIQPSLTSSNWIPIFSFPEMNAFLYHCLIHVIPTKMYLLNVCYISICKLPFKRNSTPGLS